MLCVVVASMCNQVVWRYLENNTMWKRNHPEHDTLPTDQRNKCDKKGLNGDTLISQCLVCCNVTVEYLDFFTSTVLAY